MELTVSMGLLVFVALMVMKGSLLALSSNQWSSMQTLSDAYLSREIALSNRIPLSELTTPQSPWPDAAADSPSYAVQTLIIGRLAGGIPVQAKLTRFRTNESQTTSGNFNITVWRLHSVLTYTAGEHQYVKSRSTLRIL